MTRKRKTIVIPEEEPTGAPLRQASEPILIAFGGGGDDGRDTSQPIGFDANGRPLYAPRGFTIEVP